MANDGVKLPIEIVAADTSGIEAINDLNSQVQAAAQALDDLVTSGAIEGVFDAKDIELATTRLAAMAAQATLLEQDIEDLNASIQKAGQADENYTKNQAALAKKIEQYQKLRLEIDKLPATFQEVADEANKFDNRFSQTRERAGVYGDTESSFRSVTGAIGAFGGQSGQQIESLGNLVAELLAAREALPLLAQGFGEIAKRTKEGAKALLDNSAVYGTLVSKVIALTGAKSAEAVATASLVAVALPFIAAAAAAAAALYVFTQATKGQREATQLLIKNMEAYYDAVVTGTQESLAAQIEQLSLQKQISQEQAAEQRRRLDEFDLQTNAFQKGIARIFNIGGINDYIGALDEADKETNELTATINALERAAEDARVQARSYAEALANEGDVRQQVAETFESGGLSALIDEFEAAADAQDSAYKRIAFLNSQFAGATQEQILALQEQIAAIYSGDLATAEAEFAALNEAIVRLGYSSGEAARVAQEAADAQVDALLQERDLRNQLRELVDNGSSEQLRARRDAINTEIAAILSILPELQALSDVSESAAESAATYQAQLDSLVAEQNLLTDNVENLIAAREAETQALADQLGIINERVALETQAAQLIRDASVEQINDRLQALKDEQAAIEALLPELEALAAKTPEAAAQLAEYQDRLGAIGREADFLVNEVLPQATINQRRQGLEQLVKAEQDSVDAMIEARQEALDKMRQLEDRANEARRDSLAKRDEAILKAESDANRARQEANKKYMADGVKETRDFFNRERELEKEHKEAVIKARQETLDSMLAAEEANDVIAFARAQTAGLDRLKELESGGDKEKQQRLAEFQERQNERAVEHQQTLQQIRDRENEARQAAREAYDQRLIEIQESLDEETKNVQAALKEKADAEREALKARENEIRAQYNLETNLIRQSGAARAQMVTDATAAVNGLLQNIATGARNAAMNAGATQALQTKQTFTSSSKFTKSSGGGEASYGIGQRQSFSFADSDMRIVREPTQALIGENLAPGEFEVVHKYTPSHLLPQYQQGGNEGLTLNIDLSGSNLRLDEVDARIRSALGSIVGAFSKARRQ